MEKVIKAVFVAVMTAATMFLEAQLIIWGLSMYHIHSGIWPVYLIGAGFEGILALGVASGIRMVKNES